MNLKRAFPATSELGSILLCTRSFDGWQLIPRSSKMPPYAVMPPT